MGRLIPATSLLITARIDGVREPDRRDWQEFQKRADDARAAALGRLLPAYDEALQEEAAAAERDRLRTERIEQERRAHDALIAEQAKREAEAKAAAEAAAEAMRVDAEKRAAAEEAERQLRAIEAKAKADAEEAERKAAADLQRIEAERAAAQARADKAESDRIAAEKARVAFSAAVEATAADAAVKAERDKRVAIELERKRVADEEFQERHAAAKREANRTHRDKINRDAGKALVNAGLSAAAAILAVTAIARGKIPHIVISY